ncbi:SMI1/KNR4 family protein [Leptospira sp. FAT2]|uniref:SMI1/KNR4 family protein n=1 Tax=Leptospira sanjuanensis TaxID=2879643 RepID=UPI001EE88869|nr:SMI1/KNR4 family protein [Leptospira sanjuanensis]MCG6193517.1 SMI1/KNR4 family protein [Leptospira sanjuanensis]
MIRNALQELLKLTWIKAGNKNAILNAKAHFGLEDFPVSLRELYSFADGQKEECVPIFEAYTFLSSADAIESKKSMDALALEEGWYEDHWWEKNWFPFASDSAGQYLVVDLLTGSVLEFYHDDPERPVRAESPEAYIRSLIAGLKSGELTYDADIGICSTQDLEEFTRKQESRKNSRKASSIFLQLFRRFLPKTPTKSDFIEWIVAVAIGILGIWISRMYCR